MKIGILGGTFDPIHVGHLHLALSMMKERSLDRVLVVPTPLSPFKIDTPPVAPAKDRYRMAEIATASHPDISVSAVEMEQEGPCYTIDMVRALKKEYPNDTLHLLLASDVLAGLHKWKEYSALLHLAPPLVGQRVGSKTGSLEQFGEEDRKIIERGITTTSLLNVSSTEIRKRLQSGGYVEHWLDPEVLDYITSNRLYSSP